MSFSSNFAIAKQNEKTRKTDKMYCCVGILIVSAIWISVIYQAVTILFK